MAITLDCFVESSKLAGTKERRVREKEGEEKKEGKKEEEEARDDSLASRWLASSPEAVVSSSRNPER